MSDRQGNGWHTVGASRVRKIAELELTGFAATALLPGFDPEVARRHPDRVSPGTYDAAGHAIVSVHSWLLQHDGRTILVDTGAGNDKARTGQPVFDHLQTSFLDRLAEAGVRPEQVDVVLLTHIHADHVGWNTRLEDDVWRPTFPNATVVCSAREWDYNRALAEGDKAGVERLRGEAGLGVPVRTPTAGLFEDSLRPLVDTGRLRLVTVDGTEVLPGVRLVSTPGHSLDHASVELSSGDALAVFGGDILHHPLQVWDPALASVFCEFPNAARASRRGMLERLADTGALYFSSHFPLGSAGYVQRKREGFGWTFQSA